MQSKIAIIGGGNLGVAIAEGLLQSGFVAAEALMVTRRQTALLSELQQRGVRVLADNKEAVASSDCIILAVKPFQIAGLLDEIKPVLQSGKHLLVSVVTGVWIKDICAVVGFDIPVFRAMPNTAISIRQSMTCLCAQHAAPEQETFISDLFNQLGASVFIEESLMDAATVLGACGTAFAMRYIRANIQGGVEIGFNARVAALIAAQTVKGAADLLLEKHRHPEEEIDRVATPKGCTIAGLNEMEHRGLSSSVIRGITVSYKKIREDM